MNLRTATLIAVSGAALVGSCTSSPLPEARSVDATNALASALQGRTAGPAISCIPNVRGRSQMQVIDDQTILFRDGSTIYVQNPRGGCHGIGRFSTKLVTRQTSMQLCEGDLNQLVDIGTGLAGGSCVFGPFVPYRMAS